MLLVYPAETLPTNSSALALPRKRTAAPSTGRAVTKMGTHYRASREEHLSERRQKGFQGIAGPDLAPLLRFRDPSESPEVRGAPDKE